MLNNRALFHCCPEKWDEEADILIIGSGIAGFAAADQAVTGGDRVIIFEKMPYYGGNSALAGGGYSCWDSKLKFRQLLGLGEDSWQSQMEDTIRGGNFHNLPELVEIMVKNAPAGLDWIVDAGVPFKESLVQLGCHSKSRAYQAAVSGKLMMKPIMEMVTGKGVELRLGHMVDLIYRDGFDGEMKGLQVTADGVTKNIFARKAILIASGGFSNDLGFRMNFRPDLNDAYKCSNHEGATGEVIRYAQAVGADTLHMASIQLFPCANPVSGAVDRWAFYSYSAAGYGAIYVNRAGERFVNELAGRDEISSAQINKSESHTYCIINQAICDKLRMTEKELQSGLQAGRMLSGDSPEALEKAAGLPPGNLVKTVNAHNSYFESRKDCEFGKAIGESMSRMDTGPFYAISQWPSVHYTHGGIRIDAQARVIDVLGNPIPRLYAAGEACGGVHGTNRLGGHALAECVVFGKIAGENMSGELRR